MSSLHDLDTVPADVTTKIQVAAIVGVRTEIHSATLEVAPQGQSVILSRIESESIPDKLSHR